MSERNLSSVQIKDVCKNETRGSSGISGGQEFTNNYSLLVEKIEKLTKQLIATTQELIQLEIQQANIQENNPLKSKPIALTLIKLTSIVLNQPCELRKESYFEQEIEQNLVILGKISDIYVQCLEKIENIKRQQDQFQQPCQQFTNNIETDIQPLKQRSLIFFSNIKSGFRKT